MFSSGNKMETCMLCLFILSAGKLYEVLSQSEGFSRMQGFRQAQGLWKTFSIEFEAEG